MSRGWKNDIIKHNLSELFQEKQQSPARIRWHIPDNKRFLRKKQTNANKKSEGKIINLRRSN